MSTWKLTKTLAGHTRGVSKVEFSPDGKLVASCSADADIRIWDTATGKCLKVLKGHTRGINDCNWSYNGRFICASSDDLTVSVWDITKNKMVKQMKGHEHWVMCCKFDGGGSNIIGSGSFDTTVKMWDLREGRCLKTFEAHNEGVTSIDFIHDGYLVLSSSYDGLIRVWDKNVGSCVGTVIGETDSPSAVSISHAKFTPNGKYIVASSLDNAIRLYKHPSKGGSRRVYKGHQNSKYCIVSDFIGGEWMVSGSEDKKVYIWDLQGKNIVQILEGHKDVVLSVSSKELMIASCGLDKQILLWNKS